MSLTINHFYRFGEFTLDADQRVLLHLGKPLSLTPKGFSTLLMLVEHSGRIVSKEELMSRVWPDTFVEEANLTFNIQQLRKSLGDSARRPRYIETVARRGYRFIAEVEEVLSDSDSAGRQVVNRFESVASHTAPIANNDPASAADRNEEAAITVEPVRPTGAADEIARSDWIDLDRPARAPRKMIVTLITTLTVVVALLAGGLVWYRSWARPHPSSERVMLAVLPFQNLTGDAGQEYFSDGLTEEMITQLGSLDPQHLGVIARTSVMHYKQSQAPMDQVGRDLGVQYVLEGSVRRDSSDVRVTAQLIRVHDQTSIWSREYDRHLQGLLILQREIGREVAGQIQLTLVNHKSPAPDSQPPLSSQQYEAYDLYLKGQYFLNKRTVEGFLQAINYFQRSADTDPTYARAYVGLADSYALIGGYSGHPRAEFMQKARAAALHGLTLDQSSAEAHTALALVVQNYEWDWLTAEREFRRAIELNPNYATAHHWYAEHLTWRGRFDEALSENARARQLDPLSLIIAADRGATLYFSRQYDQAIEQFHAVRELDPNFLRANVIVLAYAEKGQYAEALSDLEARRPDREPAFSHVYWSEQAYIYGRKGQRAQALRKLEELQNLNRRQEVDATTFVCAYVGVGDNDQAFAWLEKAYAQHSTLITTLKVEPFLDPLRGESRFKDLLHRVGLDQ